VELVVAIDGAEWTRISAPESLGARAWVLGVVAVQLTVENQRVTAQVRASLTGTPAQTRPLPSGSIVQIALGEPAQWPAIEPPRTSEAAQIRCHHNGLMLAESTLTPTALTQTPPPRAFGHAYCRWLRDGGSEPGFDLTDFLSRPPGEMYERKLHEKLAPGGVVAYAISGAF
jgi:hypothetical protein